MLVATEGLAKTTSKLRPDCIVNPLRIIPDTAGLMAVAAVPVAWKVTVEVVLLIVRLVKLTGALNSVVPEFWMVTAIEPERGAFTFTAPALPPLRDSVARLVVVTE